MVNIASDRSWGSEAVHRKSVKKATEKIGDNPIRLLDYSERADFSRKK
jgi:hypothetical protein